MSKKLIKENGKDSNDSGSTEVQISILTKRINTLNDHLKVNKKDNSSRRGLMNMVSNRRRLLKYLYRVDMKKYTNLIKKLKIRK